MRAFLSALAIAIGLAFAAAPASATDFPVEKMQDSTVLVKDGNVLGSGVIVSNVEVLTALHVVQSAAKLNSKSATVSITFRGGEIRKGRVVWFDKDNDLAIVYVPVPDKFGAAQINCAPVKVGQRIATIGNPMGILWSFSSGYVATLSSTRVADGVDSWVTLDMTLASGNSGGAIFDTSGRIVGIADAILTAGSGMFSAPTGFSLMVPATAICKLLA